MIARLEPFDRPPFNSPWVRATVARCWLAVWFMLVSVPFLIVPQVRSGELLVDARLYIRAARIWLDGGDPWSAQVTGLFFAAPPPTLIPMFPFALVSENVGVGMLGLLTLLGAVATIRALSLPWWWLLFPPLVQGVLAGNVQTLLVPLLLGAGGALAVLLKLYAAVPLVILGRWRPLIVAAALLLVTAPLLPWGPYLEQFPEINVALATQSRVGPSPLISLLLTPLGLVCLWVVGRSQAAWLAVPALWPSQQWYYSTLVLPTRSRLVAAIIACPIPLGGFAALIAAAAVAWRANRTRQ